MSMHTLELAKEMVIERLAQGDIKRSKAWLALYEEELKSREVIAEIERRKAIWTESYDQFTKYHDKNNY